jgi:hypothetical protein
MFGRFVVITAFLMVSATPLMGQSFTCNDDRCCYADGRCFRLPRPSETKSDDAEKARQAAEAKAAEAEKARQAAEAKAAEADKARQAVDLRNELSKSKVPAGSIPGHPDQTVVKPPPTPVPPPALGGRPAPSVGQRPTGTPAQECPNCRVVSATPSSGRILETGYAKLGEVGQEKPGYGLYSYVLITSNSSKSVALLNEIFKVIPNVQDAGALPKQINILYIPFLKEKENEFVVAAKLIETLGTKYAESFYNFQMARMILDHLCNPPADALRQLCGGDLSRGPFIFTYEKPASTFEPVQAPYLFVDLRDVHEHAFAEFVSAYQQQVKSEDVNSGERLNTLRLKVLNLTLNAADFVKPIPEALADVIHSAKP